MTGGRDFPGVGFDPAPGSVAVLERLAASLAGSSARLREADRLLAAAGRGPDGRWVGAAADAFARRAEELPARVRQARTSCGDIGHALAAFAASVGDLQREARLIEADALDARRRIEAARGQVDAARQAVATASAAQRAAGQIAHGALREAGDAYRTGSLVLGTAEDDLRRAVARARSVADRHRAAAEHVVAAIRRAGEPAPARPAAFTRLGDLVADIAWAARDRVDDIAGSARDRVDDIAGSARDRVDDFVSRHAPAIRLLADTCGAVSAALGLLGLLPPLAFLSVPAAVLGAGALAGHLALAAAGDGDWTDVALDTAGLVGFGAGRRLEAAYQGACRNADTARASLAATRVRTTVHRQRFAAMMSAEQRALTRGVALTQQKLVDATLNAGGLAGFARGYQDNAGTYRQGMHQTRGLVGSGLRAFRALEGGLA